MGDAIESGLFVERLIFWARYYGYVVGRAVFAKPDPRLWIPVAAAASLRTRCDSGRRHTASRDPPRTRSVDGPSRRTGQHSIREHDGDQRIQYVVGVGADGLADGHPDARALASAVDRGAVRRPRGREKGGRTNATTLGRSHGRRDPRAVARAPRPSGGRGDAAACACIVGGGSFRC